MTKRFFRYCRISRSQTLLLRGFGIACDVMLLCYSHPCTRFRLKVFTVFGIHIIDKKNIKIIVSISYSLSFRRLFCLIKSSKVPELNNVFYKGNKALKY